MLLNLYETKNNILKMVVIKLLLFALLISISNEGSCGITTKATKYTHCRDKKPYDERNNVCCYLKGTSGFPQMNNSCLTVVRTRKKCVSFSVVFLSVHVVKF